MIYFIWIVLLIIGAPAAAQDSDEGDLTLPSVFTHVLRTHPDILNARYSLQSTQELHEQAVAGWRPRIDGSASLYASHIDNSNFGKADGTVTKDFLIGLEQPLYRGGRTTAEEAHAKALIAAAYARTARTEQDTLLRAAAAYMDVIRARRLYTLHRENEGFLSDERQATQEKYKAGLLTKTDIEQAQARFSRGKAQTAASVATLDTAHARLEEIIKQPAARTLVYPAPVRNLPMTLDQTLAGLREHNPDMVAARYAAEAANHAVDGTLSALYPQLSAFASLNQQYDPQPGIIDDSRNATIGLRATMLFYDGGIVRSQTRQAEYAASQRRIDIDAAERRLKADIISRWRQWQAASVERQQREDEITAAQSTLDGVREEARIGERTVTDILNADYDLLLARSALIEARHQEIMAQYALSATLGLLGSE